jgi:hypothetical protein
MPIPEGSSRVTAGETVVAKVARFPQESKSVWEKWQRFILEQLAFRILYV